MKIHTRFTFILLLISNHISSAQDFIIIPNGHSHNDYTLEMPLFDALRLWVYKHRGRCIFAKGQDGGDS